MFIATMFIGCLNACLVQPVMSTERSVFYRERAAGYYACLPYAAAQLLIEIPYLLVLSILFSVIAYSMIGFEWTAGTFFWYLFFEFLSISQFTYYGIFSIAITPNMPVAYMISGTIYFMWSLHCGFIIPSPNYPGWWIWLYWINPVSWILYGFVTSQLGDVTSTFVDVDSNNLVTTVKNYLSYHFNFQYHLLGLAAAVLIAYCLLYGLCAALALKKLNFQKR